MSSSQQVLLEEHSPILSTVGLGWGIAREREKRGTEVRGGPRRQKMDSRDERGRMSNALHSFPPDFLLGNLLGDGPTQVRHRPCIYAGQLPNVDKNRDGCPLSKRERGSSMPNTRARVLCFAATQPVHRDSEPAHQNAERDIAKAIVRGQ